MQPGVMRPTKLDNGRVKIPVAFREPLRGADHVFITNFLFHERSLMLFAPDEWGRLLAKLHKKHPTLQRHEQLLEAFIFGGSANLPIDRQWRVRVPLRLLKFVHGTPPSAALPQGEPRTFCSAVLTPSLKPHVHKWSILARQARS